MKDKFFWLSMIAVIVSFAGGFILANALNRQESAALRAENERLKTSPTETDKKESEAVLTDEEIRQRIEEADQNPNNFEFQKNLGTALYRYATIKQDANLLNETARLLTRAYQHDPKDSEVLVTLGNVNFDIGYYRKDNGQFLKAREFYQKALERKPDDADVRTDLGLTFSLLNPPDYEKAIGEFQKVLQMNPKHEKTLRVLTEALTEQGNLKEAENTLARLKEADPSNESIAELNSKIQDSKNKLLKK